MAEIDYGIEEIKFVPLAANGAFPDFDTATGVTIQMIDIDTVEFTEEANNNVDVEFENADSLRLPGSKGAKTIVLTSSDKGETIAKAFKGMVDGTGGNAGYRVEDPNNDDTSTWAMQIKTRALGAFPAKVKQYTPVLVEVKETGTVGKNNLGKYSFTITRQPNYGANNEKLPGFREKVIAEA